MDVERFEQARPETEEPVHHPWYQKLGAVLYVFFCFEIGVLLVILPWLDVWSANFFGGFGARWAEIWSSPYFRGAISGLGLVDIAISFIELFRLRRFAHSSKASPDANEGSVE